MAASKSLTFEIFGKDRSASKTINGVGDSATKTGDKFKKAGVAIGVGLAAVGVALLKFGADSVQAFADADAQQRKLAFAFEKFPALADTNQKALQKLNTELQKKTRFDDDAIASAQANIAQYGLTGDQIKKLTPLMLDYAAKTGKDVTTASADLGKALLGQGRALKGVGVDFEDTGSVAGNFEEIMSAVGSKVSGFAEVDVQTASGKLENMKNRFGEIQEKVGSMLMPVLDDLSVKIQDKVLPAIEAFMNATSDDEKQAEIDSFMVSFGDKLANGAAQWGEKLNLGTQQWGDKLALGLQQWGEKLANGWNQISTWFLDSVNAWGGNLALGLDQITGWWTGSVAQWGGALSNGWAQISGFFQTIGTAIYTFSANARSSFANVGADMMQGLTNGIVANVGRAIASIRKVGVDMLNGIKDILGIHSPSRKFFEVGGFIGAGLIGGVDSMGAKATAAMERLVTVPATGGAFAGTGAGFSTGGGGGSHVTNQTINVTSPHDGVAVAQAVARRINAMGAV